MLPVELLAYRVFVLLLFSYCCIKKTPAESSGGEQLKTEAFWAFLNKDASSGTQTFSRVFSRRENY
jgi:hypothetical protein